jgi:hypothetical protein
VRLAGRRRRAKTRTFGKGSGPGRARFGQMQAAGSAPAVLATRRTCRTADGLGFSAHSYGLGFLGAAPYRAPRHRHATFWAMHRICILLSKQLLNFHISITCLAQSTYVAPIVSTWMRQFAMRARRPQRREGVASGGRDCGTVLSRVFIKGFRV